MFSLHRSVINLKSPLKPTLFLLKNSRNNFVTDLKKKVTQKIDVVKSRILRKTVFTVALYEFWSKSTLTARTIYTIMALNATVFALFRVIPLPIMLKYFCIHPMSNSVSQLLIAAFSHKDFYHIIFNMGLLLYTSNAMDKIFGAEQFLAFYLTSAFASSLFYCFVSLVTGRLNFALGASGAVYACLAAFATAHPDSVFKPYFIPYEIRAETILKLAIANEVFGFLTREKWIGHAAHLGGALFGIWYVKYGYKYLWLSQSFVINRQRSRWKKV